MISRGYLQKSSESKSPIFVAITVSSLLGYVSTSFAGQSQLYLGHSRTVRDLFRGLFRVVFAVYVRWLCFWKVNILASGRGLSGAGFLEEPLCSWLLYPKRLSSHNYGDLCAPGDTQHQEMFGLVPNKHKCVTLFSQVSLQQVSSSHFLDMSRIININMFSLWLYRLLSNGWIPLNTSSASIQRANR